MRFTARHASQSDAEAITRIYNEGIQDRIGTFETRERTPDEVRQWFNGRYPIVVVESERGEVVGFASTSSYRARDCYSGIADFSVYITRSARGHGAGRVAMQAIIDAARDAGLWKLVSRVFLENAASRALLASVGFREVGVYHKHARLDGRWRDVVVVERLIPENQPDVEPGFGLPVATRPG